MAMPHLSPERIAALVDEPAAADERTHFEPMQRDPDEVFHFVWENRKTLGLYDGAYMQVLFKDVVIALK